MSNPLALRDGGGVVSVMNQKTLVASAKPTKGDRVVLESDDGAPPSALPLNSQLYYICSVEEEGSQFSASESEPEHVPLSAAEARRTLKGPKKKQRWISMLSLGRKSVSGGRLRKGLAVAVFLKANEEYRKSELLPTRGLDRWSSCRYVIVGCGLANSIYLPVTEDYWTLESASDHEDIGTDGDSKVSESGSIKACD
jgi:hypothetical protein